MKKLRGITFMLLISLSLFGLTACQDGEVNSTYEQITPQKAKTIMDTEEDKAKPGTAEFVREAIEIYCK